MFFPVFLQLLLRKKAAEELKKEQERKAAERRRVIDQRCGKPKSLDGIGEGERGEARDRMIQMMTFLNKLGREIGRRIA